MFWEQEEQEDRLFDSRVWYIGPESNVYHHDSYCSGLNNIYRYWPVSSGFIKDGIIYDEEGRRRFHTNRRRPCKKCTPKPKEN